MSSFRYLKNLPVEYLKIDGAFIQQITTSEVDVAIVKAIQQVSHAMGIQTIAEFVENDAILQQVKALGINYAQGYCIARPAPLRLTLDQA